MVILNPGPDSLAFLSPRHGLHSFFFSFGNIISGFTAFFFLFFQQLEYIIGGENSEHFTLGGIFIKHK